MPWPPGGGPASSYGLSDSQVYYDIIHVPATTDALVKDTHRLFMTRMSIIRTLIGASVRAARRPSRRARVAYRRASRLSVRDETGALTFRRRRNNIKGYDSCSLASRYRHHVTKKYRLDDFMLASVGTIRHSQPRSMILKFSHE